MQILAPYLAWSFSTVSMLLIAALLSAYLLAVSLQRQWSRWRSMFFISGCLVLFVGVLPEMVQWAHHSLRGHMAQHLLLGMVAPLGLVLGAPVTLLLRSLPDPAARWVTCLLRSRPACMLTHPLTAMLLNIGGMYLLYLTPLYAAMQDSPLLHHLVHVHFLAAGYLFTWSVLGGPDSAPHVPGMWTRLGVLLLSIATHGILGKIMYGYLWPRGAGFEAEEIQAAAQIMYYGGDAAELLLAVALFTMWYRTGGTGRYSLKPLV